MDLTSFIPGSTTLKWLGIALAFGGAFFGGYKVGIWRIQSTELAQANHATLLARQKLHDQQVADAKARAASIAALHAQQQQSSAYMAQRDQIAQSYAALQREFQHVHYTVQVVHAVNGVCPGNPVASPEFMRDYNAAASPAHPASHPGGVPASQLGSTAQPPVALAIGLPMPAGRKPDKLLATRSHRTAVGQGH